MRVRARVRVRLAAVAAVCVVLGLVADLAFAASTVREVAGALGSDPVYVADSERGLLTIPERGRVRIRIARRDPGRIQVAVVSAAGARRAGGLGALANAVDQALPGRRGALILTTGSAFHVVTSHRAVDSTAAALRTAVQSRQRRGLDAQLLAAVNGIAEVDPGADADINAPSPGVPAPSGGVSESDDFVDDIGDSVRLGVLIVAAAIALPFLLGAIAFLFILRRRHAASENREELAEGDARHGLIAFGEEIQALDLDIEMPGAALRAREEYERALRLYDRANQLLGKDDPSETELYEARRSIEEGRSRLAATRAALAAGETSA